ncbi:tRNA (N(6)-L-threonylcarbamoyladenosine(37)-C(2))-methylthiotransferase MtaB [Anaerotruncus rubiinfantis]|uniref:tRNA (N(6)-L-threonylcarbamoyladenosine(37)-C(2))- methylthiotransferase MtaB n=1 Tax=Anaerotruncus rubiinfantis TaxID=1720200 RepID=UPI0034A45A10
MKIAFFTLGCKVNQYETQVLTQLFSAGGYEIVPHTAKADIYLVNSCTVTATGDKKTRQMLRRFKTQNPAARIVLTGCFPQAFPDAAERLPEADVITGARSRGRIVGLVEQNLTTGERIVAITPHERGESFETMHADRFSERTRAFVKIEDGCERYCSYCIIPTARGPVRSKPLSDLQNELSGLASAGYREVVLVGINLSCYGKEFGLRLIDAVECACAAEGISRVRLGSLEPELLSESDIERMSRQPKVCPQFHLSLQSGCDATLSRMNRHYNTAEYAAIVANLRRHFENCAITTDLMVGFPGETEEEFAQSLAFAEKIGFAKVHVFAYSVRPGTRAAAMPDQVPGPDKESRSSRMIKATDDARAAFLRTQVGQTASVLFENRLKDGFYEGYTENYTPVRVLSPGDLRGQERPVSIVAAYPDWCEGALAD